MTHWVDEHLHQHEQALLRYAIRLTRDHERALDLVQESFMRLCRQDPKQMTGSVKSWLYQVCRNLWVDQWRKARRMKTVETVLEVQMSYAEPQNDLVKAEVISAMLKALSDIPVKQQEVIRLKFQESFSYKEIAEITGSSVSNVGVQIHSAIKILRQKMDIEDVKCLGVL